MIRFPGGCRETLTSQRISVCVGIGSNTFQCEGASFHRIMFFQGDDFYTVGGMTSCRGGIYTAISTHSHIGQGPGSPVPL